MTKKNIFEKYFKYVSFNILILDKDILVYPRQKLPSIISDPSIFFDGLI